MWGIIPAAGMGTRIQPLGFSKELLPVGSNIVSDVEKPRAVSEYLVDRMLQAGATRICFVVAPGKSDLVQYYGSHARSGDFCYVVQPKAGGLCDAIFRALPVLAPDEPVIVGLPDTIWYPSDALAQLPDDRFSFLCFPVDEPQHFDAVVSEPDGRVREIQVKRPDAASRWVWGAFKLPARVLGELAALWREPGRGDAYVGTLVNAWLARGGRAWASHVGTAYVDVGTLHGWRDAVHLLEGRASDHAPRPYRALRRAV